MSPDRNKQEQAAHNRLVAKMRRTIKEDPTKFYLIRPDDKVKSIDKNQSQNAKRASSQKRHMVISIFLLCNSLILMSIGAGSIRAIKGGLDKVFKIRDRLHRICRQILR